ncbi:TraB/GumN family protein [Paenibacillus marinisediminis]
MKNWRTPLLSLILSVGILASVACAKEPPQQLALKINNQEIEYASNAPIIEKGMIQEGARGFMWEVKNNGTTVYLVGSVHVTDDNFYPLHSKYEKAFSEADYLGLEVDLTKPPNEEQQKMVMDMMMYKDGTTLKEHVSKETYTKVADFLMRNGLKPNAYDTFKPWKVDITIFNMALKASYNTEEGIDLYFLQKALERKIPVIGLETYESQTGVFASFSKEKQEKSLNTTIDNYNSNVINDSTDELIALWKKGDDQSLLNMANDMASDPEYQKVMQTDRNISMADKIEGFLNSNKEEEYFVVVGALHYPGEHGIIKLLQDKGYTVVRK